MEIGLFVIEGYGEALCFGVVIVVSALAYADFYTNLLEGIDIGFRAYCTPRQSDAQVPPAPIWRPRPVEGVKCQFASRFRSKAQPMHRLP